MLQISPLFVFFLGLLQAWAGPFQDLESRIGDSFSVQAPLQQDLGIARIRELDLSVDTSNTDGEDLARIKYLVSHWRNFTRDRLVALSSESAEAFAYSLKALDSLAALLRASDLETLARNHAAFPGAVDENTYEQIVAEHGDPSAAHKVLPTESPFQSELIPALAVRQVPMYPHLWWGADGWLGVPGVENYRWDKDEVLIRGQRVRAGDLFIVDLAAIYDGINTSFSSPRSSFTHIGIVVFLHVEGKRVPAVLEILSLGIRVVPLARYVSPDFVYYGEFFRYRDASELPLDFEAQLENLTRRLLKDQMAYDYSARPIPEGGYEAMLALDQRSVMCSSTPRLVYGTAGISLRFPWSQIPLGARLNISRAGLTSLAEQGAYLTPTDLKRGTEFQRVGTIDNGLDRNLVREWMMGTPSVPGSVGALLTYKELDASALPFLKGGALYYGLDHLARFLTIPSFWSRQALRLTRFAGITERTIPQAPPKTMATVVALNNRIEAAGKRLMQSQCEGALAVLGSGKPFDLTAVEVSDEVRGPVERAFKHVGFDRAFK